MVTGTHPIFNCKGKNVLEKSDLVCRQDASGQSHLHRLIVKLDSPVRVEIHQNEIYSGNMNHDWELLKPKITRDLHDKKLSDWVDTSREMR